MILIEKRPYLEVIIVLIVNKENLVGKLYFSERAKLV